MTLGQHWRHGWALDEQRTLFLSSYLFCWDTLGSVGFRTVPANNEQAAINRSRATAQRDVRERPAGSGPGGLRVGAQAPPLGATRPRARGPLLRSEARGVTLPSK